MRSTLMTQIVANWLHVLKAIDGSYLAKDGVTITREIGEAAIFNSRQEAIESAASRRLYFYPVPVNRKETPQREYVDHAQYRWEYPNGEIYAVSTNVDGSIGNRYRKLVKIGAGVSVTITEK